MNVEAHGRSQPSRHSRSSPASARNFRPLLNQRGTLHLRACVSLGGVGLFQFDLSLDFPVGQNLSLDGTLQTMFDQPSDFINP